MLTFTEDVTVPEDFHLKVGASRNEVNVYHHSHYIGHVTDVVGLLYCSLFSGEDNNGVLHQKIGQYTEWKKAINAVVTAYQQANPVIVDRLPSDVVFEARTVYFVPQLAKFPLKVIAQCENEQDAEDIATFFRNRDKIYAYAWTDANSKPTLLSNLK